MIRKSMFYNCIEKMLAGTWYLFYNCIEMCMEVKILAGCGINISQRNGLKKLDSYNPNWMNVSSTKGM
jgi:hypothetical protein